MIKKISLLLLLAITPAFAVQEFYSISRSIRSLGMGGAYYGLSNDQYALFYNPAGLSLYKADGQGMLEISPQMGSRTIGAIKSAFKSGTVSERVNDLQDYQGDPIYGEVAIFPYYLRKHFAVGLLLADIKADVLLTGKNIDSGVDLTAISDSGLIVGYGNSFFDENLHFGINAKGIYRAGGLKTFELIDIAQNSNFKVNKDELGGSGLGIDADLGMMYELQNLPFGVANNFGVSISNLLASEFKIARSGGAPPGLCRTLNFGWHTTFAGWNFVDNFHLLVDIAEINLGGELNADRGQRAGSFMKHVNLGLEMPIGILSVRTGIHQGYWTAGLGVNLTYFRLEAATYGEELGNAPGRLPSRRFALTLAFGAGNGPSAPITSTREVPIQPQKKEESEKAEIKEPAKQPELDKSLQLNEKPKQTKPDSKAKPRSPKSIEEGAETGSDAAGSGTDSQTGTPSGSTEETPGAPADMPGEKVIEANP